MMGLHPRKTLLEWAEFPETQGRLLLSGPTALISAKIGYTRRMARLLSKKKKKEAEEWAEVLNRVGARTLVGMGRRERGHGDSVPLPTHTICPTPSSP